MLLIPLAVMILIISLQTVYHVSAEPVIHDENLALETVATNLCCRPTGIEFVDNDTMLVIQKSGHVMMIRDGVLQSDPILVVETTPEREMGLLGIAAANDHIYLYYTVPQDSENAATNRIERYTWDGNSLTDPIIMMELPANLYHNGGAMITGPDRQVYAVIGDTGRYGPLQNKKLQDIYPPGTTDYMDTSVILRVDPPGPYLAVGIRNSFGLAFDHVTGIMWATENGDDDNDEINMIQDGFNSGWQAAMGPATDADMGRMTGYEGYEYKDPIFTWYNTVAPTGITFAKFAQTDAYDNAVFVGDCNFGRLYMFELNPERDGFVFDTHALRDGVADEGDPIQEIIVAEGLGCLTGIRTGPDGYVYLASYSDDAVYRIVPTDTADTAPADTTDDAPSQTANPGGCLIATAVYGTELAPQVQWLREIRDTKIMSTESGTSFMSAFNTIYYSFSPAVADLERQNYVIRYMIGGMITPMIYSLSLMDIITEQEESHVIFVGIMVILLNVMIYVAAPIAAVYAARRHISGLAERYRYGGTPP